MVMRREDVSLMLITRNADVDDASLSSHHQQQHVTCDGACTDIHATVIAMLSPLLHRAAGPSQRLVVLFSERYALGDSARQ